MSLFKAREWWSSRLDREEEFGSGGIAIGNLDNSPHGESKIVTGSFSGMLRVFHPRQAEFNAEDLVHEEELSGGPILQIEIGQFQPSTLGSGARGVSLAVLHPRSLSVYNFQGHGDGGAVSYYKLDRMYEHKLERSAYNMTFGRFGNAKGTRDMIAVQSMDGQLAFFEQDALSFTRFLPNFLLPSPICYVPDMDSFIICNSQMDCECYGYKALLDATSSQSGRPGGQDAPNSPSSGGLSSSKKVEPHWKVNLGEHINEISVGRYTAGLVGDKKDIILLGERSIFCLQETGSIRLQRRLDFYPACSLTYPCPGGATVDHGDGLACGDHNLVVATHDSVMNIYRGKVLIWAQKMNCVPLRIFTGQFGGIPGFIVTLEDNGTVDITYVGTDPPASSAVAMDSSKDLNYEEMDEEHRRLLSIIRETTTDGKMEPTDRLLLEVAVPDVLDAFPEDNGQEMAHVAREQRCVTVPLMLSYTGGGASNPIENLSLSVNVQDPIVCHQASIQIPSLPPLSRTGEPLVVPLNFRCGDNALPVSMKVTVISAFTSPTGEARTAECTFDLPLCLVCRTIPPIKSAMYKLMIETNRLPASLGSLFGNLITAPTSDIHGGDGAAVKVLTFQYFSGLDCTVLAGKDGKYRVQSNNFEALWLVLLELTKRVRLFFDKEKGGEGAGDPDYFINGDQSEFAITFTEALPLQYYFQLVDQHFACRQELTEAMQTLADRAQQLRVIEKRLLVRFKDRNPTPLNHLDDLLRLTYQEIMKIGDEVARLQGELAISSNHLSCGTHLVLLLIRYRFNLSAEDGVILSTYLTPEVKDTAEQGWDEMVDASLTHLLRTTLAKSGKDAATQAMSGSALTMPADTTKLKKHITLVCDRLSKGMTLSKSNAE